MVGYKATGDIKKVKADLFISFHNACSSTALFLNFIYSRFRKTRKLILKSPIIVSDK
jgi:hypothetical protein